MKRILRGAAQLLTAVVLLAVLAGFSQGPAFSPVPAGHGELKVSLAHLAGRLEACRPLSEEERQALPPTRRVTEICERRRSPTEIRLTINGVLQLDERVEPAGLHGDGRAYFLRFLPVPAGRHELELALRDQAHDGEYNLVRRFTVEVSAGDSILLAIGDGDVVLRPVSAVIPENPT